MLSAKLSHGTLQHDIEVFPDDPGTLFREIESSLDAQGIELLTDTPADTPDILYGYQGQQPTLAIDVRQVNHPAGLALPLFRSMISQLGKGFRLGNAYTDSQVRALQDRRSYLVPEICQIPAVSYSRQITKSLINAVNFYPRRHLLECGHYPVRHISVKLVITAEANNTGSPEAFFLFEEWLTWCDTELFRLSATRDNAAIIV